MSFVASPLLCNLPGKKSCDYLQVLDSSMSARALEQAIEHPDIDMAAAPAGKDTVGVVEDTGEKQRHSHAA